MITCNKILSVWAIDKTSYLQYSMHMYSQKHIQGSDKHLEETVAKLENFKSMESRAYLPG